MSDADIIVVAILSFLVGAITAWISCLVLSGRQISEQMVDLGIGAVLAVVIVILILMLVDKHAD